MIILPIFLNVRAILAGLLALEILGMLFIPLLLKIVC